MNSLPLNDWTWSWSKMAERERRVVLFGLKEIDIERMEFRECFGVVDARHIWLKTATGGLCDGMRGESEL